MEILDSFPLKTLISNKNGINLFINLGRIYHQNALLNEYLPLWYRSVINFAVSRLVMLKFFYLVTHFLTKKCENIFQKSKQCVFQKIVLYCHRLFVKFNTCIYFIPSSRLAAEANMWIRILKFWYKHPQERHVIPFLYHKTNKFQ